MELEDATSIHVLLVSFPAQGHINPMLTLAKRLALEGLLITLSTTENVGKEMTKSNNYHITDQPTPLGNGFIRFEFFQDGIQEDDDPKREDLDFYVAKLQSTVGKNSLSKLIKKQSETGRPVSCLVNNPFIPWVYDVAEELGIPCATFWFQSCALFATHYHYFYKVVPFPSDPDESDFDIRIPSMPVLKQDEIPSFVFPTCPYNVVGRVIFKQLENLSKAFCVLADTFEELEGDIIREMSKFCPIRPIGPLFRDPKASRDGSTIRGDLTKADDDCIGWLDSKPPASVVYISFGSVVQMMQEQVEEVAHALLNSGLSFLWVMKPTSKESGQSKLRELPSGFLEKTRERGRVVRWSPQEKVLSHPSVTCFLSHCGWNSSLEALSSGVPVVTFPQWGDQIINAKFLVDVFAVGVRLSRGAVIEKRVVSRDEIVKCLMEATAGEKAAELKRNALKWKAVAEKAVAEGGSSDQNIRYFVEEIRRRSNV